MLLFIIFKHIFFLSCMGLYLAVVVVSRATPGPDREGGTGGPNVLSYGQGTSHILGI